MCSIVRPALFSPFTYQGWDKCLLAIKISPERCGMLSDGGGVARQQVVLVIVSDQENNSPVTDNNSFYTFPPDTEHREKNGHFLLIFKYFTATMNPI